MLRLGGWQRALITLAAVIQPISNGFAAADSPEAHGIKLRVSVVPFKGCVLDPTAMGCPVYEIRVVDVGGPIRVLRIMINRRYKQAECIVEVQQSLNVGDDWSGAGGFQEHCGKQLVHIDVVTDKGIASYGDDGP